MKKQAGAILFGPDVVRHLLPHRRPFLMFDVVTGYERKPQPTMYTSRHISANEAVFDGHFPGLHLWPGVYTIEGMGQTANLLHIISTIQRMFEESGKDPDSVITALVNLQRGYELKPGYRPELSQPFLDFIARDERGQSTAAARTGMSAAVDVKLLQPVFAGQRLDFRVTETHVLETLVRFDVQAQVDGQIVAKGIMTGTRGLDQLPPAAL